MDTSSSDSGDAGDNDGRGQYDEQAARAEDARLLAYERKKRPELDPV